MDATTRLHCEAVQRAIRLEEELARLTVERDELLARMNACMASRQQMRAENAALRRKVAYLEAAIEIEAHNAIEHKVCGCTECAENADVIATYRLEHAGKDGV